MHLRLNLRMILMVCAQRCHDKTTKNSLVTHGYGLRWQIKDHSSVRLTVAETHTEGRRGAKKVSSEQMNSAPAMSKNCPCECLRHDSKHREKW